MVVGLDTGQRGALTVFKHYAEARGLLSGRLVSEAREGTQVRFTLKDGTERTTELRAYF